MSIQSEIERVRGNIASAYAAVTELGGEVPSAEAQNSGNLAQAVQSIPLGSQLVSLEVDHPPEKVDYFSGETFDPAGLALRAQFSNGALLHLIQPFPVQISFDPAGPLKVGVGQVTVKLVWDDEEKNCQVPVNVERIPVAVPSQSGSLTYTGEALTPDWNGYNEDQMNLSGEASAVNAGSYDAVFTLKDGFCWPGGSVAAKTVQWTIGKAAGNLSVSASAVTLGAASLTQVVSITRAGDGAVTAVSSNTSVAEVAVSADGTSVTISHVNQTSGTATITIEVAEDTNHTAPTSKTVTVTASFAPPLNDYTWAQISEISVNGQGENYWNVGDRKAVHIKGSIGTRLVIDQTLYVYILGFNHNSEKREGDGIHFGTFKTDLYGGTDVCLVDGWYNGDKTDGSKVFNMNHWGNYNHGGWKACDLRYDILGSTNKAPKNYGNARSISDFGYDAPADTATNPVSDTLMAALPVDLRAVMKPVTKYTDNNGNRSNVEINVTRSVDYLPLLSECEIFNWTGPYTNQYERKFQAQYTYYAIGNSSVKYRHNKTDTIANWFERSPSRISEKVFCIIYERSQYEWSARTSYGLAPIFRI